MGEMGSKSDGHHKREWTDTFSVDIFSLQIQWCASLPREHIWYVNVESFSVSDKLHCMCAAEPSLPIVLWILADLGASAPLFQAVVFIHIKDCIEKNKYFFFFFQSQWHVGLIKPLYAGRFTSIIKSCCMHLDEADIIAAVEIQYIIEC